MTDESEKLPSSWRVVRIGQLCDLKNGRAFKPSDWTEKGLPIVRIQNLNNPEAPFNHYDGEVRDRFLIEQGNLLFAWSGTPGTSFGAHIWRGGKAVLNQHIFRVDFDERAVEKSYFRFAINNRLSELIEKAHGGVGLRHVTKGKFEETTIPLPPLKEQQRIVAKIEELFSELDKGVESLTTARAQLKAYRYALLKGAFSGDLSKRWRERRSQTALSKKRFAEQIEKARQQSYLQVARGGETRKIKPPLPLMLDTPVPADIALPNLPDGWHWVPLQWLLSVAKKSMTTGPFGTMLKKQEHRPDGVPVLGIENIGRASFVPGNKIFVDEEKAKELAAFEVQPGDILISRSGTVGEICMVPDDVGKALISTNLMRISLNTDVISPEFFVLMFQGGGSVKEQVKALCKGSSREFLNQGILQSMAYPLCGLDEQRVVISEIESGLSKADALETEIDDALNRVSALRQSILKQAFSGHLVSQDPADEPASVLLERIRAKQEKGSPKKRRNNSNGKKEAA